MKPNFGFSLGGSKIGEISRFSFDSSSIFFSLFELYFSLFEYFFSCFGDTSIHYRKISLSVRVGRAI